ncbi:hypothetical protein SISNIDRAFT_486701 [Sistotremastrum niveocremeum HHB9708]|uniref:Uncharacterized protein n=1 Tax=Sistotremastrum niveocremeum HHB9708 TaxID=1314777 RepID=A0A164T8W4_9AGAM|nr:hypothetical protein SISNIDRAFT_486701 [Sistotremastrum niveocremeum HHB9708]
MDALGELPPSRPTKKESVRDLLTIFSDTVKVKFTVKDDDNEVVAVQTLKGRWCLVCREDPKFAGSACRGAFKLGGNSSCRQHI